MTSKVFILFIAIFCSSNALAGLVIKVQKKSKLVHVNEVFNMDEKVCFLKEDEEIPEESSSLKLCGRVIKMTESTSIIKVDEKIIKKIKKDMTAYAIEEKVRALKLIDDDAKDKVYSYFKGFYIYSAITPIGYNGLLYDTSMTSQQKYWKETKKIHNSLIGFGAGSDIPIFDRWIISPGLRYRVMEEFVGEAAFSEKISTLVAETRTKMSALGIWLDVEVWRYPAKTPDTGGGYRLSSGLDLDYSTMKFSATRIDKKNKLPQSKFATAYGSTLIPSFRISNELYYSFRSTFGLFLSINALIPITEIGKIFNPDFQDVDESTIEGRKKDLEESLGYKKNPFSVEILIGVR